MRVRPTHMRPILVEMLSANLPKDMKSAVRWALTTIDMQQQELRSLQHRLQEIRNDKRPPGPAR